MISQGNPVGILETIDRGSGYFYLKPTAGETYTAVLDDRSKYILPKVMEQGYSLEVDNMGEEATLVNVRATDALKQRPFYVVGQMNNQLYYQGKFQFGHADVVELGIPKDDLPSGVMSITLLDESMKPWCERIVFINKDDALTIEAKVNTDHLSKRNKVTVDIRVKDSKGNPVSTPLSMAITDMDQVAVDPHSGTINSYLLLESDIKGHIQDPGALFKDRERVSLHAIDLIMLTHGWRKFPWRDLAETIDTPKKFKFSEGILISGMARGRYDNPLKEMTIRAVVKSGDVFGMYTVETSKKEPS